MGGLKNRMGGIPIVNVCTTNSPDSWGCQPQTVIAVTLHEMVAHKLFTFLTMCTSAQIKKKFDRQ